MKLVAAFEGARSTLEVFPRMYELAAKEKIK